MDNDSLIELFDESPPAAAHSNRAAHAARRNSHVVQVIFISVNKMDRIIIKEEPEEPQEPQDQQGPEQQAVEQEKDPIDQQDPSNQQDPIDQKDQSPKDDAQNSDEDAEDAEDEEEDDVKITIEDVDFNIVPKYKQPKQPKPAAVDLEAGQAILDVDLNSLEDKPWRKPGADLSDYFNYGFDEDTWKLYCEKQKKMRGIVNEMNNTSRQPTNEVMKIPTIVSVEPRQHWMPPVPSDDIDRYREREDVRTRDRDRDKSKDRDRDREREKTRDREKIRDREKDRDREKTRDRDKNRDRDKVKDRERTKDRDRDRYRESKKRERSRERDRDKKRKRT